MSFRRDKDGAMEWKRWLTRCRARLVACGLPVEVYQTQRAWWYFLEHANIGPGHRTDWFSLDRLAPAKLSRLRDFIEAEYGDKDYPPLILQVLRNATATPERFEAANNHAEWEAEQEPRAPY